MGGNLRQRGKFGNEPAPDSGARGTVDTTAPPHGERSAVPALVTLLDQAGAVVGEFGPGFAAARDRLTVQRARLTQGRFHLAVLGQFKRGKSTLLLAAGGLLTPTSGSVMFEGTDLGSLSPAARAGWRAATVGFVFQQFHLLPYLSVIDNVLAATLATPSPASPAPAVLAFDEPDAHFHPSLMKRLVSVLERAAERTAVVVATHSDRFLDFLSDPATSVRVLEAKGNGTCVRRLDSSTLDAWREHYTVSELRARGQLDPANSERDPAR